MNFTYLYKIALRHRDGFFQYIVRSDLACAVAVKARARPGYALENVSLVEDPATGLLFLIEARGCICGSLKIIEMLAPTELDELRKSRDLRNSTLRQIRGERALSRSYFPSGIRQLSLPSWLESLRQSLEADLLTAREQKTLDKRV